MEKAPPSPTDELPSTPRSRVGAKSGAGRPRDHRIDEAVLAATRELLEEVGYLKLTIGAIATRAGTNRPSIYRRWPTKAHVVHEAVFPAEGPEVSAAGDDLRSDIAALVAAGVEILTHPAAKAAVPGLLAETNRDPDLHLALLGRFDRGTWAWLHERIQLGVVAGEVRADVEATTVLELIAGSTLAATLIEPVGAIDPAWVDRVVDIIMRGIAP